MTLFETQVKNVNTLLRYGGKRPAVDAEKPQCICCNSIIRGGRQATVLQELLRKARGGGSGRGIPVMFEPKRFVVLIRVSQSIRGPPNCASFGSVFR